MEIKLIFGVIAFILTIIGVIPYIVNIVKKKTTAHIYSWLIWGILQLIAVMAQIKNGAGYGSMSGTAGVFICFLIVFLSLKNGFKNIRKFDTFCLILSVIAIFIYVRLNNPLLAVVVATITNFMGFLPTLRKAYKDPKSETAATFLIGAIATLLSLLALQNYTILTTLYLINILMTNSLLTAVILLRKS